MKEEKIKIHVIERSTRVPINRLVLAGIRVFLAIASICFFMYFFVNESLRVDQFNSLKTQLEEIVDFAEFIRRIGVERGNTAIYLASNGSQGLSDVLNAQANSRILAGKIFQYLRNPTGFWPTLAYKRLLKLLNHQELVRNLTIVPDQSFAWYLDLNEEILQSMASFAISVDYTMTYNLNTILYLTWLIEYLGVERGLVSQALTRGTLVVKIKEQDYSSIRRSQQIYNQTFATFASPSQLALFQDLEYSKNYSIALSHVSNVRKHLLNCKTICESFSDIKENNTETYSACTNITGISTDQIPDLIPRYWFANMTMIIDSLFQIHDAVVSDLYIALGNYKVATVTNFVLSLLGLLSEGLAAASLIYLALPALLICIKLHSTKSKTRSKSINNNK